MHPKKDHIAQVVDQLVEQELSVRRVMRQQTLERTRHLRCLVLLHFTNESSTHDQKQRRQTVVCTGAVIVARDFVIELFSSHSLLTNPPTGSSCTRRTAENARP